MPGNTFDPGASDDLETALCTDGNKSPLSSEQPQDKDACTYINRDGTEQKITYSFPNLVHHSPGEFAS
jgi:hypothetical protein